MLTKYPFEQRTTRPLRLLFRTFSFVVLWTALGGDTSFVLSAQRVLRKPLLGLRMTQLLRNGALLIPAIHPAT